MSRKDWINSLDLNTMKKIYDEFELKEQLDPFNRIVFHGKIVHEDEFKFRVRKYMRDKKITERELRVRMGHNLVYGYTTKPIFNKALVN